MILVNQIPKKSLFKVQEVCELCNIKPYVLRFWDSEFDQIQSVANSAGKKLYQKRDILVVSVLKDLLFERKLTIEKARDELSEVNFDAVVLSQMEFDEKESISKEDMSDFSITSDDVNLTEEMCIDEAKDTLGLDHSKTKVLEETAKQLNLVLDQITELKYRYNWS
jgi:DNA-binding transcriptional MerR regulator